MKHRSLLLAIAVAFGLVSGLLSEVRSTSAENCGCAALIADCCCASEQDDAPAQPATPAAASLDPKQISEPARVVIATLPLAVVKEQPRAESRGPVWKASARIAQLCVRTI